MNITILANRDLASNFALNHLLPVLHREHHLRVYLSDAVGGSAERPRELVELRFFEQTLFNDIVFPLVDESPSRGTLLTFADLGEFTEAPITSLNRINDPASLELLRATAPDIVLSIRYGGILREAAIAIPKQGVINLHSGLLPAYRGVMATFHALLAGEREIGTTIHRISDSGIDTGAVIARTTLEVTPGKSYLWHVLQLYPPACDTLINTVNTLSRGEVLAASPQAGEGQYFSFPKQAELEAFRARGHTLVDVGEITAITQRYIGKLQGTAQ